MTQHWTIVDDFAVTTLPNGSTYDVWLNAPTDWVAHLADKAWITPEALDELRQILAERPLAGPGTSQGG